MTPRQWFLAARRRLTIERRAGSLRQRLCRHRSRLFSNDRGVHTWLCPDCRYEWPREAETALRPERERAIQAATDQWWKEQELKQLERWVNS